MFPNKQKDPSRFSINSHLWINLFINVASEHGLVSGPLRPATDKYSNNLIRQYYAKNKVTRGLQKNLIKQILNWFKWFDF